MIRPGNIGMAALLLCWAAQAAEAQQYTGYGDPTPDVQFTLELINRARADPVAEGNRLSAAALAADPGLNAGLSPGIPPGSGQAGDITEGLVSPENIVGPRPPLAMNAILIGTARAHSQDMYANDYFAHNTLGGVTPEQRMINAGFNWMVPGGLAGENIAAAESTSPGVHATAEQLENLLMIDFNIPDRGHRVNLLSTTVAPFFREVGIGYFHNDTPTPVNHMTDLLTQDFGRIPSNGPFVLGVAYNDVTGIGFYDPTRPLAGVTVELSSGTGAFAVTASAGGFAFPVDTTGPFTIRFTGGPLGSSSFTQLITPPFPGENVKVDFNGTAILTSQGPGGSGGSSALTGGGHHSGGGCGSTGLELLGPLALLRLVRRRTRR